MSENDSQIRDLLSPDPPLPGIPSQSTPSNVQRDVQTDVGLSEQQNAPLIVRHGAQLAGLPSQRTYDQPPLYSNRVTTSTNRPANREPRESALADDGASHRRTVAGLFSRVQGDVTFNLTNDGAAYEDDADRVDETHINLRTDVPQGQDPNSNDMMINMQRMFAQMASSMSEAFERVAVAQVPRTTSSKRNIPYKYGGEDYEDPVWFVAKINEIVNNAELDDDLERVSCLVGQLYGRAKQWYEINARLIRDYNELTHALLEEFNSFSEICQIRRRVQGEQQPARESAMAFINRKRRMCERVMADAPFAELATMIIDQLEPELGMRVSARTYTDFNELTKWAKYYEERLRIAVETNSIARYKPQQLQRTENRATQQTSSRPAQQQTHQTPNVPNNPCRFCKAMHFHNQCPQNPYRQGNSRRGETTTGQSAAPNTNVNPSQAQT